MKTPMGIHWYAVHFRFIFRDYVKTPDIVNQPSKKGLYKEFRGKMFCFCNVTIVMGLNFSKTFAHATQISKSGLVGLLLVYRIVYRTKGKNLVKRILILGCNLLQSRYKLRVRELETPPKSTKISGPDKRQAWRSSVWRVKRQGITKENKYCRLRVALNIT